MRIRNYFFAASAIVLAASCVKENTPESSEKNLVNYVPMEFSTAVETKTELTAEGKVNWLAGDQISIIDNSPAAETHNNQFTVVAGGSSSATFTGTVPEDADEFYALYPYKSNASITDGSLSASLPANQNAKLGSFADDLAFMIAKADADNKLSFKNVCSHIKFTLAEGITNAKSITLMGNKAEILAGNFSVAWNNGDPAVTVEANDKAETYVTLRNEDGSVLAPGEYYFTVLPVTFTEGFTVIISKEDGSQIAKSTTLANDKVSTRNKVLVMKPLKAADYTSHLNYFVKYNDGFDLTFGGVTINNETHPGGILVSDNKSCKIASSSVPDGVYFIDPNCTSAKFENSVASSIRVLIGADASVRSNFLFWKAGRLTDGGKIFMLANLDCAVLNDKSTSCNGIDQNTGGGLFSSFGNVVFSNCHFRKVGNKNGFLQFANQAITNINICVEDCEFGICNAVLYLISTKGLESVMDVSLRNNIFYVEDGTTVTDFKLFNSYVSGTETTPGAGATANNLDIQNNTFVGTVVKNTGFAYFNSLGGNISVKNNYFVETQPDEQTLVYLLKPAELADGITCEINSNFYWSSISKRAITLDKNVFAAPVTFAAPKGMSGSPIEEDSWNPAEGVFGPYKSVTYTNNGTEVEVPSNVGAQRPNMTGTADAASYRFPAVDLGTF